MPEPGLGALLDGVAAGPDDPLVHEGVERAVTRAEVEASVEGLAVLLRHVGVEPGQVVAVSLPDDAALVAALFATWRVGAAYVPLNPRLSDPEVDHVLAEVDPAVVVTLPADAGRFDRPVVLATGEGGWRTDAAGPVAGRRQDDGVALVSFTSGTTGRPKPVLLRHDGVLDTLDAVIGSLRSAPGGGAPMPNLVPVSLSLWAGIYQVLFAFRVGASIIVLPRFDPQDFAAAVHRFGIRSTVLPPAAMVMLNDDPEVDDLGPLRYVRSISAPLSPLQARRFHDRFGAAVLNCWGQTELGGEVVGWTAADWKAHGEDKLGAVGRPHEGVEVRTDPDTGEIEVRTPALSASGFADGSDLGQRLTPDGFLRTGDIGRVDDDGFLWIEGRVSDMVNRGGLKVFPAEVAEVLLLDPAVVDAAVVGVPDDRLGEVPVAFVVPEPGAEVDPDALEALCREHLAPYKVPVRFEAIDQLPRNEVGKVLGRVLAERATRG